MDILCIFDASSSHFPSISIDPFPQELKLSVEALDLLQHWMEQLLRQTLAKAARLARHGAAGDGNGEGPGEIRAQELRMALELQGFANLGC